jgi:hypothetical protein
MRVTISHNKTQQEVKDAVDRGMDNVFTGLGAGVVDLADRHKEWHGNTMVFTMSARMGFIHTPIKGSVEVGEKDVTIELDLGLLGKLVPEETVRAGIESRVKGLLT